MDQRSLYLLRQAITAIFKRWRLVAVMQKGYTLHDRVLRPALVTVAKPPVEKAG